MKTADKILKENGWLENDDHFDYAIVVSLMEQYAHQQEEQAGKQETEKSPVIEEREWNDLQPIYGME